MSRSSISFSSAGNTALAAFREKASSILASKMPDATAKRISADPASAGSGSVQGTSATDAAANISLGSSSTASKGSVVDVPQALADLNRAQSMMAISSQALHRSVGVTGEVTSEAMRKLNRVA